MKTYRVWFIDDSALVIQAKDALDARAKVLQEHAYRPSIKDVEDVTEADNESD